MKQIHAVFIDNYDSFTNTIVAYFENAGAKVTLFTSDCSIETIEKENPNLIILGPGPNGPREAGNYLEVINYFQKKTPIFGICLGFQAMMEYFGEPVKPLGEVMHGQSSPITHTASGIFANIEQGAHFARYHSLGVHKVPNSFTVLGTTGTIIMSAGHKELPIYGVQFHPESILSMHNDAGKKLIANVLSEVQKRMKE